MRRRYCIYDVFTNRVLTGNPLAVVFDGDGLDEDVMQVIAAELNLSETVFVQRPANPSHTARVRIFTPARELPFAGHPTVGTAVALAELHHGGGEVTSDFVSVLEENVGPVRCAVRLTPGEAGFAEFDLPRKSVRTDLPLDRQAIADALGLKATEIGFENHVPSIWGAGVPFLMVPVHDLRAAERIEFDAQYWERTAPFVDGHLGSAYVYCRGGINHNARFHARMFAPDMGIAEDPATGAAVAALSGAIHHFDALPDGRHATVVEQGIEMGRPSFIHLHMDIDGGLIAMARIGGEAVRLASGELYL